jgi:hypothetical protein
MKAGDLSIEGVLKSLDITGLEIDPAATSQVATRPI